MKQSHVGSFQDIRPAKTGYVMEDASIMPCFDKGGRFMIEYRNHFGETVRIPFLMRVEASTQLAKLRSRGYRGNVKPMA